MHIDLSQRPCAACGSTSYAATATWDFSVGPRCICLICFNKGCIFDTDGRVVRGRRLEVAARAKQAEEVRDVGQTPNQS